MRRDAEKHGSSSSKGRHEPDGAQPHWRSLFAFTTKAHICVLIAALVLSILSGLVVPTLAIFLGMTFNSFTEYGAGSITSEELSKNVSKNVIYLVALASLSCILSSGYFILWLFFGELQAKSARDKLYDGMLHKEMEWYDMRKAGVNALMPRIQTFVHLI